jgi:hypothetical protein
VTRTASGISPEELALQDAYLEGVRSGRLGHGASMNPYLDFFQEHHEWNRGRLAALGQSLNRRTA